MFSLEERKKLLDLEKAAEVFGVSKDFLRVRARGEVEGEEIRAAKLGKRWKFNPDFLKEDLDFILLLRSERKWESSQEKTAPIGGFRTRAQTVREYEKALKLKERAKKAKTTPSIS